MRRKPKTSGPSDFCRLCASSFAIRLRNLGKASCICAENLFRRCWHTTATMSVTQSYRGESSFYNIFWNFASKVLCCRPKTMLNSATPISGSTSCFVDKTMERIISSSCICFNIRTIHFFCCCVGLIYQTFLKVTR